MKSKFKIILWWSFLIIYLEIIYKFFIMKDLLTTNTFSVVLFSIPWIIMYVYLEILWSFMALIIGYGAFIGYKTFKGKMDIKVPYIVGIVSILIVVFVTLYVIPCLLIMKEGITPTSEVISFLYSNSEFKGAIIKDLIFALLFTVLGVSGIFKTLKVQAQNGEELTLKKKNKEPKQEEIKEEKPKKSKTSEK